MPTLSEHESKQLLRAAGIPVGAEELVADATEAGLAADRLGYPVVVKACGSGLAHKTERGLVRLGLSDRHAVELAAVEVLAGVGPDDGDVAVLVARQVDGHRELILGFQRDPQFGPVVMLGVGGVFAETFGDVAFRLAPLDHTAAMEMIGDLSTQTFFEAFRGEPAIDPAALAEVVVRLADAAVADERVVSVDVNPLIVAGTNVVAVDALVEVRAPDVEVHG